MRDGRFVWVSPSVEEILGATPEYWLGREMREIIPPEDAAAHTARAKVLAEGGVIQTRARVTSRSGVTHWIHLHAKPFYDADGRQDGLTAAFRLVDDEVATEQEAAEARRQQARADERFRRSMTNAAIGMCLVSPDGGFVDVNDALCELFGYDAETLKQKTWQELTAPEYMEADLKNVADVLDGRIDSYRMLKQYIHADGHRIWGDLSVSCVRDDNGQVENFVSQIADITAAVEANERNSVLAQRLQQQSDRMAVELESAAAYMASIMPIGLTGPVDVVSRYLPSRELGGDCFDYTWIDDDHLLVYLIDVSGHGLEPALLSVSVHNMLRSGSLGIETLLSPASAVSELNRLFQMEEQGDHYFTIWYGVYERSSRTLRYVNAGAPAALAFNSPTAGGIETTELPSTSTPVGMFRDAEFTTRDYSIPPCCRMLIYSDGANEINLNHGRQLSHAEFMNVVSPVAGSRTASLDDLVADLRAMTPDGLFEDDFSLIKLTFD